MSKYLITGTAGFIGFHLANKLLERENEVVGLDDINDYYDISLKYARLSDAGIARDAVDWNKLTQSARYKAYRFTRMRLEDKEGIATLFKSEKFDYVINLAAQAGVRYSIENPDVYIRSNITGFYNILEACRKNPVKYLLYASSSSVYGNNEKVPFSETDYVDNPVSLYAATKKSNELIASTYRNLYGIASSGLRFFTVYGPWGRPDMAIFKFTNAILNDRPLTVYAGGRLLRDFTYVDDIVNGITAILEKQEKETPPPLMNIGNNNPVSVNELISQLELCTGRKAKISHLPMQQGDVNATFADISLINSYCGFRPLTDLKTGLKRFYDWYLGYLTTGSGHA